MLDIIRSHRKNNLVSKEKCQMTPTTSGYDNILGSTETAVDPVKELSLSPSESKILPCIVHGILTWCFMFVSHLQIWVWCRVPQVVFPFRMEIPEKPHWKVLHQAVGQAQNSWTPFVAICLKTAGLIAVKLPTIRARSRILIPKPRIPRTPAKTFLLTMPRSFHSTAEYLIDIYPLIFS